MVMLAGSGLADIMLFMAFHLYTLVYNIAHNLFECIPGAHAMLSSATPSFTKHSLLNLINLSPSFPNQL
jgi:hypothetical protein